MALDLLPQNVERILYLDADMLIKKELTEVYGTPMSETCPFAVCDDIEGHTRGSYQSTLDRVAIPSNCQYFNSGFMLMNLKYLRKRNSIGYILDAFYREHKRYPFPDQDVLNHMYYDKVQFVPWALYNLPPEWWNFVDVTLQIRDNEYIIHYMGFLKPWMYRNKPMYSDLALYAGLWFDCEKVEGLERL